MKIRIQVLGMGCPRCARLYANAELAARALGLDYEMEKIDELERIAEMGVTLLPALAVNGKVLFSAKVPSAEELKKLILGVG